MVHRLVRVRSAVPVVSCGAFPVFKDGKEHLVTSFVYPVKPFDGEAWLVLSYLERDRSVVERHLVSVANRAARSLRSDSAAREFFLSCIERDLFCFFSPERYSTLGSSYPGLVSSVEERQWADFIDQYHWIYCNGRLCHISEG